MFEIKTEANGRVLLVGRFDAAQTEKAMAVLSNLEETTVLDCSELVYLSSAAYGVLFKAQRRLVDAGHSLKLVNLSPHLREMFEIAGFDQILQIE
jgi:anti-sigma B factor antagonist